MQNKTTANEQKCLRNFVKFGKPKRFYVNFSIDALNNIYNMQCRILITHTNLADLF